MSESIIRKNLHLIQHKRYDFLIPGGMRIAPDPTGRFRMTFGKWLAEKRAELRVSGVELEKRSGVSRQYISNLERELASPVTMQPIRPSLEIVEKLARGLQVDVDEARIAAGYAAENSVYLGNPKNLKELLDVLDRIPGFGGITFSEKFTDEDLDALSPEAFQEVVQAVQLAVTLTLERQSRSRPHDNPTADAPTKSPPHR
jgi:transcriptional regulator with XRE-family HTH domain